MHYGIGLMAFPLGRHPPARHPLGRYPSWEDTPRQTPLLGRHHLGRHPPEETPRGQPPPLVNHPPGQTPLWADTPHMVNELTVCILLECILVLSISTTASSYSKTPEVSEFAPYLFPSTPLPHQKNCDGKQIYADGPYEFKAFKYNMSSEFIRGFS